MRHVRRDEIVDYVTYNETRPALRDQVLALKAPRRIHLGDALTFLFETTATVRYQVQEMMRAEQIVKESDIQHEIDTYNELLGGDGELGCTLLIEIDDPEARAQKLVAWKKLPEHLYVRLEDGTKVRPSFDRRQIGEDRLSSVKYLKFATGRRVPIAVGTDHPAYLVETTLTATQREALRQDLGA